MSGITVHREGLRSPAMPSKTRAQKRRIWRVVLGRLCCTLCCLFKQLKASWRRFGMRHRPCAGAASIPPPSPNWNQRGGSPTADVLCLEPGVSVNSSRVVDVRADPLCDRLYRVAAVAVPVGEAAGSVGEEFGDGRQSSLGDVSSGGVAWLAADVFVRTGERVDAVVVASMWE
jgi:hypothetical protein